MNNFRTHKIIAFFLAVLMILPLVPVVDLTVYAVDGEGDYSANIGKHASFILNTSDEENVFFFSDSVPKMVGGDDVYFYYKYEIASDFVVCITDYKVVTDTYDDIDESGNIFSKTTKSLWYRITAVSGTIPDGFVDGCWIMQNYLNPEDAYANDSLSLFDAPAVPEGTVSITDANGNAISTLAMNKYDKPVLKATSSQGANASYSWQIEYAPGEWADIYGEDSATVKLSYGMVASILAANGTSTVNVRCKSTLGADTIYSDPVSVTVYETSTYSMSIPRAFADDTTESGESAAGKCTITVNYSAGTAGLTSDKLPKVQEVYEYGYDDEVTVTITFPEIKGYLPYIQPDDGTTNTTTSLASYSYSGKITQSIVINVVYYPTTATYTVEHYWQNVEDDNYTLHMTETKDNLKTEDMTAAAPYATDAELAAAGFYALKYVQVAIAGDGSTVVQIFYNRFYYLVKFDLNGDKAYGARPVYARHGTEINVDTPVNPGYTFAGWDLNGDDTADTLPESWTVPVGGATYKAIWSPIVGGSKYTVSYWLENPNDDGYSFLGSSTVTGATAGETASGSDSVVNAGFIATTEIKYYTYNADKTDTNVTISGDGSTVVNVYYDRNEYTLKFYYLRSRNNTYQIATNTNGSSDQGGTVADASWSGNYTTKPTLTGYTEQTETSGDYTYYYFTIAAKYGANLDKIWPNAPLTEVGNYSFVSWGTQFGSGYHTNNSNKNIKGMYSVMDEGLLIDAATVSPYVNHWMVAYWNTPTMYTYEIYYSLRDGETSDRTYNGVGYKKIDQYTVGSTDVPSGQSPLSFEGVTYVGKDYDNNNQYDGNVIRFYYQRNTHTVTFNDQYGTTTTVQKVYGESLADLATTEPAYPSSLVKDAYEFGGWYLDSTCTQAFDFATTAMGNENMVLYAKWSPIKFTITFYVDKADVGDSTKVYKNSDGTPYIYNVEFGAKIQDPYIPPANPVKNQYQFEGWFYEDDDGIEQRWEFDTTTVQGNEDIYAKWLSNEIVDYTVHYYLKDTTTPVAPSTSGSELAGKSVTIYPKVGVALYENYQEGYFPTLTSHTLTMEIKEGQTEYIFWYEPRTAVPYTVYYLTETQNEAGTLTDTVVINGKTYYILRNTKTVSDNKKAVATENALMVPKYKVDAEQKTLILDINDQSKNVIVFYYTEDVTASFYQKIHYIKHYGSDEWIVYSDEVFNAKIDSETTVFPLSINGYTHSDMKIDGASTAVSNSYTKIVDNDGVVFEFYYTENTVTIEYKTVGKGTVTNSVETVGVITGSVQGSTAQPEAGYQLVGWYKDEACTQRVSTSPSYVPNKESAIYYAKFEELVFVVRYETVGPDGATNYGTLSITEETVYMATPTVNGSTPTAKPGYRFDGWYLDSECQNAVSWENDGLVDSTTNSFVPFVTRIQEMVNPTFYAKFVEIEVTINYVVVGPTDDCGTVTPGSEKLGAATGKANGSVADPNDPTFKFVGWYSNAACTDAYYITADAAIKPIKDADALWIDGTTYYAKFEYNLTSLTISKTGWDSVDPNQTFIFNVSGGDVNVDVTIHGNGSVTIYGLTVGQSYTITEKTNWSWRYECIAASYSGDNAGTPNEFTKDTATLYIKALGVSNNIATFTNNRKTEYWLDGDSWCDNRFMSIASPAIN